MALVVEDTHQATHSQTLTLATTSLLADRLALAETVETTDYLEQDLQRAAKTDVVAAVVVPGAETLETPLEQVELVL
jgi:hypothetical protein